MKRINLKGPLIPNNSQEVYDYYGMEAVSSNAITKNFPEDNSDIVIEVSSNGGLVTTGSEIYTALKNYPGNVTAEITGMAASAASVAVMGANKVVMSPTAQMMIHKASFRIVGGNSDDLETATNALKASDQAIVNAYVAKTGLPAEDIMAMMEKETYMSANEAVKLGFADEVMSFDVVASRGDGLLPQAVIDDYFTSKTNRQSEINAMRLEIEKEEILQGL